jgi:RNA polymerase sigma-70 factor, ECF subfamily
MDDDLTTIQKVLDGDVDCYRKLVERYQGIVFGLVGNLVADRHERDDIAQETFLAAYVSLGSYDDRRAKFSTWLLTIARNKCMNALKRRRPTATECLPPQVDYSDPAESLMKKEAAARFDRFLDALPADQKSVFVLSEIQEVSYEEIAQIEGVPLGTVKSRISRAKENLRSLLSHTAEEIG